MCLLRSFQGETDQDKLFSEREVELKKPFAQRIEELVSEKMMADSKATGFYLECVSLKKRIKSAENKKIKLEQARIILRVINTDINICFLSIPLISQDLASAFEQTRILREESTAVTSNYESQLSMMSEHVAVMNEKISAKSEEIETLKFELANKKGRK